MKTIVINPERNVLKAKEFKLFQMPKYIQFDTHFFVRCRVGLWGSVTFLKMILITKCLVPKIPKRFLRVSSVGGADSSLYNSLKGKYKVGYIANTKALHMKTRQADIIDIPKHWNGYIDHLIEQETRLLDETGTNV